MDDQHIILKSGKDQAPKRYHPWIFSGGIKNNSGNFTERDIVKVFSNKDELSGVGHYQPGTIGSAKKHKKTLKSTGYT